MTDSDYLYCIMHMWAEAEKSLERLCPSCRDELCDSVCVRCGRAAGQSGYNPNFDNERFRALAGGD